MEDMKDESHAKRAKRGFKITSSSSDGPDVLDPEWYTNDAASEDRICVICSMLLQDPHALGPCDHMFCSACIKRLPNAICPICRAQFNRNLLLPRPGIQRAISKLTMTCRKCKDFRGDLRAMKQHWLDMCAPRRCDVCGLEAANAKVFEAHPCVVKCDFCNARVVSENRAEHDKQCTMRPTPCSLCNETHTPCDFDTTRMAWRHIRELQTTVANFQAHADDARRVYHWQRTNQELTDQLSTAKALQDASAERIGVLGKQVQDLTVAVMKLTRQQQKVGSEQKDQPTFGELERVRYSHEGKFIVTRKHWNPDELRRGDVIAMTDVDMTNALAIIDHVDELDQAPLTVQMIGDQRQRFLLPRNSPKIHPAFLDSKARDHDHDQFIGTDFDFLRKAGALTVIPSTSWVQTLKASVANTSGGWTCCGKQSRLEVCR